MIKLYLSPYCWICRQYLYPALEQGKIPETYEVFEAIDDPDDEQGHLIYRKGDFIGKKPYSELPGFPGLEVSNERCPMPFMFIGKVVTEILGYRVAETSEEIYELQKKLLAEEAHGTA